METRRENSVGEKAISIDPIALCMLQYFNLKEMHTYSLINHSTAAIIQKFTQSNKIKKNIELSKKINRSLQDDAKKMLSYSLKAKNKEENKDIQTMLTKIAAGEADKKLLDEIKTRDWDHQSKAQEVCIGVSSVTADGAKDYWNFMTEKDRQVKEHDIYILLILYGVSGISYLTNLAVGIFNNYFYKPPQAQFKQRLHFLDKNMEKVEDNDKDNDDNKSSPGLSK